MNDFQLCQGYTGMTVLSSSHFQWGKSSGTGVFAERICNVRKRIDVNAAIIDTESENDRVFILAATNVR